MNLVAVVAALAVGITTGALFTFLRLPLPAPPELPGVVAILGIYVGYVGIERLGWGFDLLEALGF
ncbi:XapX domain-containing protein [Halolamina salifodinae]|uniref:XapX domain-containing protein n=1 Tax=Halolamina salifodinae TaxID=1202767 RepID=A0A8T4GZK4_9EURY|nr:XapX domain-containing protein [Halolamina salifodinae]MBP1987860.1 XapX domain-containing protein [Halolamina salifodinae]